MGVKQRTRLVREPSAEKRWLNRYEADMINDARCLPDDHSSWDIEFPIWTDVDQTQPVLDVLRQSGLVGELEKRLRSHPGRKSRLSVEALLLGVVLAASIKKSYRRADVCAVLNGLDAKVGYALGLWTRDHFEPVTYEMVRKQLKRLENTLAEGWTGPNGRKRDLAWFCHTFIAATIPDRYRPTIEAVAVDSTVSPTWAVTRDFRLEKDALAEHRLASLETPDLPEPELPTTGGTGGGRVGSVGPDGRLIRTADIDARPTYKSATSAEAAQLVTGYDLHIATAVRSATWTGDPNRVALGPAPLPFITAVHMAPGATNPGPIGLFLVEQTKEIAARVGEAVLDRAYSAKRQKLVRPLHEQGVNVVMDYTSTEINKPKLVKVGRKGQRLLVSCGTLFSPWLPKKMQVPPDKATPAELAEWYTERAQWRWTPNQNLKGGGKQFRCAQCAGRVTTSAKTRNGRATAGDGPFLTIGDEYCCYGLASVRLDLLDAYQDIPYGTPASKQSYGRRNRVETRNSVLKDKGALSAGWCRAFGLAAQTVGALALAVAHNLRILEPIRRQRANGTASPAADETADIPTAGENPTGALSSRGPP